jgi:hypothetical protein
MRVWLSGSDLAATTQQRYRAAARRYLLPTLGSLLIGELTVPAIEQALAAIRSRYGPQPARAARRAPSSLCHGALRVNPVRDTRPIACPRKRVRALTVGAAADLLARLCADNRGPAGPSRLSGVHARHRRPHRRSLRNPPSGAGPQCRNCAHQRHCRTSQPGRTGDPATHQDRRIRTDPAPPTTPGADAQAAPADRSPAGPSWVIFTSPTGLLRDPSNTQADLRQALNRGGLSVGE